MAAAFVTPLIFNNYNKPYIGEEINSSAVKAVFNELLSEYCQKWHQYTQVASKLHAQMCIKWKWTPLFYPIQARLAHFIPDIIFTDC